jgi:hypothetical protein
MELFWKSKKWNVFKRSPIFGLASSQNQKMKFSKEKKKKKQRKVPFFKESIFWSFELAKLKHEFLKKKKCSFFRLVKNENYHCYYYCYYFQGVHFWSCELFEKKKTIFFSACKKINSIIIIILL